MKYKNYEKSSLSNIFIPKGKNKVTNKLPVVIGGKENDKSTRYNVKRCKRMYTS